MKIIKKEEVPELLSSGKLRRTAVIIGVTPPNGNLEDISSRFSQLEERLSKAIKEAHAGEYFYVGYEIDGGEMPLLMIGDAEKLLKAVYPILRDSGFDYDELPI